MVHTPRFAVVGAGNGGYACAAELALRSYEVLLLDLPAFDARLEPVRRAGGIHVDSRTANFGRGEGRHFAAVPVSTDLSALAEFDVVVVVVPGQHHGTFIEALLPHMNPRQVLLLNPGGVGGALVWRGTLRRAGLDGLAIAQASDLLYAGSRHATEPAVAIGGKKANAMLGVLPTRATPRVMELLGQVWPEFAATNVLEAGLSGPGMLLHPLPMLMNAVRIDREGAFTYDSYDITKSVARAVEALDVERLAVVSALGGRAVPIKDVLTAFYGVTGADFHETVLKVPGYQRIKAPADFHHRYITEEVPTHLVPTIALGEILGTPTPLMRATVALASAVAGCDFAREGWTIQRLGIEGMDRQGILRLLESGS
jgi:opine dehydrogenase